MRPDLVTEPPVRLLAVDDDPISRRAMSLALAKAFNAPDLAPDGLTALALAGRQTYDVIFLDVEMPGMDGFELCTKIHETELNRTTPVVFVTRHSDFDSRAKSTELGARGSHLGKPFLVFEITVKALTLVMRARLDHGEVEPASANQPEAAATAAATLATRAAAASRAVALPGAAPPERRAGQDAAKRVRHWQLPWWRGAGFPPPSSAAASAGAVALRQLNPAGLQRRLRPRVRSLPMLSSRATP